VEPFVLHEFDQIAAADLEHLTTLGGAGDHGNHLVAAGAVLSLDAPALQR
jgi:hypothetical protein